MNNKDKLFSLLGQISIYFASIEHRLNDNLAYLLAKSDETLVSPYVLDKLPISQLINKIRPVAELRLWEYKDLFEELKEVLKIIEDLRQQRNLFIHGDWLIEDLIESSTYVTVLDYKPKLDRSNGLWEYMHQERVNHQKLNEMLHTVKNAFEKLVAICNKIRDPKVKLR